MNHFNDLTPAEAERLALLSEEMGEAQQAIGKILRHGYESYSPYDETKTTNRRALTKEIGDVLCAVDLMVSGVDLSANEISEARDKKRARVGQFLHHQ